MEFSIYLLLAWFLAIFTLLLIYAGMLRALWQEPMFASPILIIESDDWGAGPLEQADALRTIADILCSYEDSYGNHPVMTIALIMAIPDKQKIEASGAYHRIEFDHNSFTPIRAALDAGVQKAVFSTQLHGLEHYWPSTLMSSKDIEVRAWLRQDGYHMTEELPSHLQSRWTNASVLPSVSHDKDLIARAAEEEISTYVRILGNTPLVAVPTTFVWDDEVEKSWSRHGVEFVVTPGRRYSCRGSDGEPSCTGPNLMNGDTVNGITYVVRDEYFEPEKGHTASQALEAMVRKTSQGRPCLLETHRSNFLGSEAGKAFKELDSLLGQVRTRFPDVRFIDTLELAKAVRDGKHEILQHDWRHRLRPFSIRIRNAPRLGRLARVIGLELLLKLLGYLLVRRATYS